MKFAVSYGNGNDGLSRLYPDFFVEAPEGSEFDIARLALITSRVASRRWIVANVQVDEMGENAAQSVLYNPPRSPHWCEHNGAWKLAEAYPAAEASERSEAPEYASLAECFGAATVRAYVGA